jgi:antitoxin component HigA of HigAB toxin-antitoxin module
MTHEECRLKIIEAERLMQLDPEPASPEGMELLALVVEISAFEEAHFKFKTPTAAERSAFRREQREGR